MKVNRTTNLLRALLWVLLLAAGQQALAHPMPSSVVLLDLQATSVAAEAQLPLPADPEHWFKQSQQYPGSWWTAWSDWLALQGGDDEVPARAQLGSDKHPPIEPAPGRYVKAKAT